MSKVLYYYGAVFGEGDSSDRLENEIELTKEEKALYDLCFRYRINMNDVPLLTAALDREYHSLKAAEEENLIDGEDEYVMECLGLDEMDPDDLNDLVHSGDQHALEFFDLLDAEDEMIQNWDAYDLDDLPLRKDFDPDFSPVSPFDEGYTLNLWYPDPDDLEDEYEWDDPEDDKALLLYVRKFMQAVNCDRAMLKLFFDSNYEFICGDEYTLQEAMIKVAEKLGKADLVEELRSINEWEEEE